MTLGGAPDGEFLNLSFNSEALEEQAARFYEILEEELFSPEAVIAAQGLHQLALEQARVTHNTQHQLAIAEKLSLTDALTGLSNRRAFDRSVEDWAVRLNKVGGAREEDRQKRPNALLMIGDLDAFKLVNDVLGYEYGDHVLRIVAQTLRECTRYHDELYRLGGDEFAIIAPVMPGKEVIAHSTINYKINRHLNRLRAGKVQSSKAALDNTDVEALRAVDITFASGVFTAGQSKEELLITSRNIMRQVKETKEAKNSSLR